MQISIQTSPLYCDLLGDEEVAGILASSTEIRAMISVELALAQAQSNTHATTLMAARTRTQLATPITPGLRLAQWAQPLIRMENQLPALKHDVLRVQFGGAAGANTAVAPHGPAIAASMAKILNLTNSPPWHTDRSGIVALSNWLLQICLSLSKMAKDLMIMSRSEIAELTAGKAGGSSTMPQKANPIQSEMVVALGTIAQALHGGICAAASPAEERDGASWTVEWVLLPQLLVTAGCALRHCLVLVDMLVVDRQRMQSTVNDHSQLMAEAASFAQAEHLPRTEAQALVKQAAASALPLSQALSHELARCCQIDLNWDEILDPSLVVCLLHTDQ